MTVRCWARFWHTDWFILLWLFYGLHFLVTCFLEHFYFEKKNAFWFLLWFICQKFFFKECRNSLHTNCASRSFWKVIDKCNCSEGGGQMLHWRRLKFYSVLLKFRFAFLYHYKAIFQLSHRANRWQQRLAHWPRNLMCTLTPSSNGKYMGMFVHFGKLYSFLKLLAKCSKYKEHLVMMQKVVKLLEFSFTPSFRSFSPVLSTANVAMGKMPCFLELPVGGRGDRYVNKPIQLVKRCSGVQVQR